MTQPPYPQQPQFGQFGQPQQFEQPYNQPYQPQGFAFPPQQGHPQMPYQYQSPPPAPTVRPGLVGAVVAVAALALCVVGLFVEWAPRTSMVDLTRQFAKADRLPTDSVQDVVIVSYVLGAVYALILIAAIQSLLWTLGAIRGRRGAFFTFGWWAALGVRGGGVGRLRIFGAIAGLVLAGLHTWAVLALYNNKIDALKTGPWLLLAGAVLFSVANAIGPRTSAPVQQHRPAMPSTYPGY